MNSRFTFLTLVVSFVCAGILSLPVLAQNGSGIESYKIPSDAIKSGPRRDRGGLTHSYSYRDRQSGELIAREHYAGSVRVKLTLFKNKKKHGIQKEWYENGSPKSEESFADGIRNGLFRHWLPSGLLVGRRYRIENGTGVMKIYHENGRIRVERHWKDNKQDGPSFEFYETGQAESLNWKKMGQFEGLSIAFHLNGAIYCLGRFSKGRLTGPVFYFGKKGEVKEALYVVQDQKLSKQKYEAAREEDGSLPEIPENVQSFRDACYREVKSVVDRYKAMAPIELPEQLGT